VLTDQPLYRARGFEPLTGLGDVVFLLDATGPISKYTTPFFVVAGIMPVSGISTHGLLILYNQASAAVSPTGYGTQPGGTGMIPEAKGGANIAAGGSVSISNPQILQGQPMQLLQWRFSLRTLALTGPKEHDIEMQVTSPGKTPLFGIAQASPGFVNMLDAFQDPADAIDSPAQTANQALPAAFPAMHPRDEGNMREFFVFEDNGPTFQIWNNGVAITGGAIGIRLWGFRYDLVELDPRYLLKENGGSMRWLYGQLRAAPPTENRIRVVATVPYTATAAH
jgi:hypothetical protein